YDGRVPDVMRVLRRVTRNTRLRRSVRRLSEVLPLGGTTILRLARSAESGVLDHGRRFAPGDDGLLPPPPPTRYRVAPRPTPVAGPFDEPLEVEDPGGVVRSLAPRSAPT